MSRKNREKRPASAPPPRKSRAFRVTPTKVFIGIIVLMIVVAAVASAISGRDNPDCPPGQVWSDAHNHCH
jgi:hypothetical protein